MYNYSKYPQTPPKYCVGVEINLNGESGNIFYIIAIVRKYLQEYGVPEEELKKFNAYITSSNSYETALSRVQEWAYVVYKYEED